MASLVLNEDPSPPSNNSKSFPHDPLSSSPPLVEIPTDDTDPLHPPHDPLSSSPQFVEILTDDTDPLHRPSTNQVLPSHSSINSILEPPSYADAIFQSFDSDYVASPEVNSQDQSLSVLPPFSSDYIKICVSDPQKEHEQSGSLVPEGSYYFTYVITTFTNLPEFNGAEFNFVEILTDDTDPLHQPSTNQVLPSHSSINSILEPPSYADAIFQSFDSDYVASPEVNSQDQSLSVLPSFSSDYIKICVSDPQKEHEQSGSLVPEGSYYFTYVITTFTNLPEFNGAEFNVRRSKARTVAALCGAGRGW
ncbi:unnamed protein product [Fraxinus pennsylvanica]|uniref:Uncharacterized protein n=1 Tax=Fraxinus pennsylvanica TaxID=56036 RepID=A0AAD2DNC1_9LAMI|nr:unnamed protein product [Fraxinus pennsylvanica]